MKETNEEFDLVRLRKALVNVVATFKEDLRDGNSRRCLAAINDLTASFVALERLGVPPPSLVRLRQEQGAVRRAVLRIYHIQDTEFLPSAYILIETVVLLIIGALVFTKGPGGSVIPGPFMEEGGIIQKSASAWRAKYRDPPACGLACR